MRSTAAVVAAAVVCHAALSLSGSDAFVVVDSSRAANTRQQGGREGGAIASRTARGDGLIRGPVLDLRGGKTVGSKKAASGSGPNAKASSSKKKMSKSSSKGPKKPSFVATVRAFFVSLVNPHFVLKLQAKQKDQINTVHGSASTASD